MLPAAEEPGRGARAFTRDPSQLQGTILQTALRKSPQGFGFTIIGGDRPDEFLQVKNVLPDGPAAHDNKIASGNLLPAVQAHPGVKAYGGWGGGRGSGGGGALWEANGTISPSSYSFIAANVCPCKLSPLARRRRLAGVLCVRPSVFCAHSRKGFTGVCPSWPVLHPGQVGSLQSHLERQKRHTRTQTAIHT